MKKNASNTFLLLFYITYSNKEQNSSNIKLIALDRIIYTIKVHRQYHAIKCIYNIHTSFRTIRTRKTFLFVIHTNQNNRAV